MLEELNPPTCQWQRGLSLPTVTTHCRYPVSTESHWVWISPKLSAEYRRIFLGLARNCSVAATWVFGTPKRVNYMIMHTLIWQFAQKAVRLPKSGWNTPPSFIRRQACNVVLTLLKSQCYNALFISAFLLVPLRALLALTLVTNRTYGGKNLLSFDAYNHAVYIWILFI